MKKTLKLMLAFALVALGSTSAWAQGTLVGTTQYNSGFKYHILQIHKGGVCEVSISQNVNEGSLVIPATVTIPVNGTDQNLVSLDENITFKVVEIEANAFKNLTSATSIEIGSNIRAIRANAFDGCTNVTSITFDGNTNNIIIEDDVFKGINKVTELDLTPITGKLAAVNKWWNSSAFTPGTEVNGALKTVKFPAKVEAIVADAFAGFTALETVEFKAQPSGSNVKLTIGAGAFQETAIETLDLTEARIYGTTAGDGLNRLFEYNNVTLKKVIMSKYVNQLNDMALADCIQLNEVDFSQSTVLKTLGAGSLSNTVVPTYDFSKCYTLNALGNAYTSHLDFQVGVNPFVNGITTTNKNLKEVKLPLGLAYSPVKILGTTFANCEVLTTIKSLDVSKVTEVVDGAFANDKSLEALEFPLSLTSVAGAPFAGCEKLATLTFNNQNDAALTIGNGTNIFGTATASLAALETLNINTQKGITNGTKKTANVTIATGALAGCTGISELNIAVGGIFVGTINTFALNEEANATITIGDIETGATFATLTGPKGIYTTALTTGSVNITFGNAIVDGIVSKATVGEINEGSVLTAIGQAKEIKFKGNIKVALDPAAPNNALTTIDFGSSENEDAVNIPAGNIPSDVFDEFNAPNLVEVTWKPADAAATKAFAQDAFGTASKGTSAMVTLHTTTKVGDGFYALKESNLWNVIFDAVAAPATPVEIEVYGTADATYYYGKMQLDKKVEIAKTNDDGDQVEVYSAFVDTKDQAIYMDRLSLKDGVYVVAKDEVVIIRVKKPTTTTDHPKTSGGKVAIVKAFESNKYNTMRYIPIGGGSYKIVNDLRMTDKIFSSDYIGTTYIGKTLYAMANPAKLGALQFDPVAKTSYLPKGAVFVETAEIAAPAELRVVWLDESDDVATIIENIQSKKVVNNGKIYNMQGIEVDSSYKGFVIKNGKKIYQK